ncbi:MAG: SH3 domain-containing protein [Lachnospiraceae bacterium]|nr:SH3 domain-containing protein [Lachnospiraceae bacterium]
MFKEKMKRFSRFLLENSKLILPIIIILAVAITVLCALRAQDAKKTSVAENSTAVSESTPVSETTEEEMVQIPLTENTDPAIVSMIDAYYTACAQGDIESVRKIINHLDETKALFISAKSEYVEDYLDKVVYSKPGPKPDSYLLYVYYKMKFVGFEDTVSGMDLYYACKNADGSYYLNDAELSDEEKAYIDKASSQEDVIELNNRVEVECKDTLAKNEELFLYIQEVLKEAQKTTGEAIANQMKEEQPEDTQTPEEENGEVPEVTPVPVENDATTEPVYAKATTTVNVRASDSEQADKVDKVTAGTKVEVLEQKVNGWSKVKIGKAEGYIKSEYLQLLNTASKEPVVGTVTATSNVNVRTAASETADRLGVLAGGEAVDLLGRENGWCKINYNGQVGYVKEDFVQ